MSALLVALVLGQQLNLNKQPTQPMTGAFGGAIVVPETVALAMSFPYNHFDPLAVSTAIDAGSGGSSVTADGGHAVLTVGTSGFAEVRTRLSARYIPGQGMSARFTFTSNGCGARRGFEVGAGDAVDGFAFGCCASCGLDGGASFGVLRRSNGVDYWTPAERWNGPWGTTPPDPTKGRPYQVAWQWLGYGQITYSIEDATTGAFVVAHAIKYAGTSTETSIANPTLPLRAVAWSNAADAGQTVRVPSMSMIRQGEEPEELGIRRGFQASRSLTTSEQQVWALRDNPTFNGKVNRSSVHLGLLTASNTGTGSQDVILRLRLNAVTSGAVFNQVSTFSICDADTAGNYTSGGQEMLSIVVGAGLQSQIDLTQMGIHLAPGDVLSVTGQTTTGTPPLRVSLSWLEEI